MPDVCRGRPVGVSALTIGKYRKGGNPALFVLRGRVARALGTSNVVALEPLRAQPAPPSRPWCMPARSGPGGRRCGTNRAPVSDPVAAFRERPLSRKLNYTSGRLVGREATIGTIRRLIDRKAFRCIEGNLFGAPRCMPLRSVSSRRDDAGQYCRHPDGIGAIKLEAAPRYHNFRIRQQNRPDASGCSLMRSLRIPRSTQGM